MIPPVNRQVRRLNCVAVWLKHSPFTLSTSFQWISFARFRKPTEFELKPLRDSATLTSKLLSVVAERTVTVRSLIEDETLLQDLAIERNGTSHATGASSQRRAGNDQR